MRSPVPYEEPLKVKADENPLASAQAADIADEYSRREPEEEFFMLSVLALKMTHTEEYQANDYVYEISA